MRHRALGVRLSTLECPFSLPQYSATGTWIVESIGDVDDNAANRTNIDASDFAAAGIPQPTFEVASP